MMTDFATLKILALHDPVPVIQTATLPRCTADLVGMSEHLARWKRERGKDLKCERKAHYVIDGKPLCTLHAGTMALKILCAQNRIEPEHEGG